MAFLLPALGVLGAFAGGVGGIAAGTGLQVLGHVSDYMQTSATAKAQGEMSRDVAQYNARILEQEGETARLESLEGSRRIRDRARRAAGAARAQYLKGGVTLSGSALETLFDMETQYALEALDAERKGASLVTAKKNQAALERARGQYAVDEARYKREAGLSKLVTGIGGTLLTGGSKIYDRIK